MDNFVIWHNSRCSKSRETLALLRSKGVNPTERYYLEEPPTKEELETVLGLLGKRPIEITRTKDKLFKELGYEVNEPDEDILALLLQRPALIERPIVIKNNDAAVIGRPPENILSLLF